MIIKRKILAVAFVTTLIETNAFSVNLKSTRGDNNFWYSNHRRFNTKSEAENYHEIDNANPTKNHRQRKIKKNQKRPRRNFQEYHRSSARPHYRGFEKLNDCNLCCKKLIQAQMKREIIENAAEERLLLNLKEIFSEINKVLEKLSFPRKHEHYKQWQLALKEQKRLNVLLNKKARDLSFDNLKYLTDCVDGLIRDVASMSPN